VLEPVIARYREAAPFPRRRSLANPDILFFCIFGRCNFVC
jgi:hypothetical protein